MDFIYLSSGLFGKKVLESLNPKPTLVITQPDRLGGRGQKTPMPTEVKKYCRQNHLHFEEATKNEDIYLTIKQFSNPTFFLVCDFGVILKSDILNLNPLGIWNLHPSLLPKYRGSSPIQSALLNGDKETGVTLIKLDEQIDHGPILAQEKIFIDLNDTNLTLMDKLASLASSLFTNPLIRESVNKLINNPTIQNHESATFTKRFTKEDGFVEFSTLAPYLTPIFKKYNLSHLLPKDFNSLIRESVNPLIIHHRIRAFIPWPLVWTTLPNDKTLKILLSEFSEKENKLVIKEIQIEGKKYNL